VNVHAALLSGVTTAVDEGVPAPGDGPSVVNRPNPFNPTTTILFSLDRPGFATLEIFDVRGRRLETLVARELPAGEHAVAWTAAGKASGVYIGRLTAGGRMVTRRIVLLK
jgi:hypothetical protein